MRDQPAEGRGTGAAPEVEELRRRLAALEALASEQAAARQAARNQPTTKWLALLAACVVLAGAAVVFGQGAVEALFVSREGNVGIGTNVPKAKMDVDGALRIAGKCPTVVPTTQGGYLNWNQVNCGTGETDFINHPGLGKGGFYFANTADNSRLVPLMLISGEGNVGIGTGTAEPAAKLEVAGRVKLKEIEFSDGSVQTASIPARAVLAFNSTACPAGWAEYAPARGRFVRGIDTTGGRGADPDGRRQPGATQEDAIQNITGSLLGVEGMLNQAWMWGFKPGSNGAFSVTKNYDSYNRNPGGGYNPGGGIGGTATFDASRVVRTAAENRPKNVALLYCEKQ